MVIWNAIDLKTMWEKKFSGSIDKEFCEISLGVLGTISIGFDPFWGEIFEPQNLKRCLQHANDFSGVSECDYVIAPIKCAHAVFADPVGKPKQGCSTSFLKNICP